ncbi:hypothetical protein GGF48_001277 [Coemansia sp. RSA 921]|nr:hypothetical protein GGF48_001277 [Coemansia sp. RSA 921]KAJ2278100.1 hypothetical protein EV176_001891 [Coemansia sp. RSA 451]KAJ2532860.1 hypothetical protein GGH20_000945 [Coemansia sp. RSA 1937]
MSTSHTAESTQNALGILASLASPVPASNGQQSLENKTKDNDMLIKTPKLSDGSRHSLSPPHSPSTQAAMRKTKRDGSDIVIDDNERERETAKPGAIPATQLDVLALVTATSPPMPSRRRWAAHSTPKPAFAKDRQLPARNQIHQASYESGKLSNEQDSDNETVSEDEQTLRSYSSRARARHQSVHMRPLPRETPRASALVRTPRTRGQKMRRGRNGSDGDTTETDEDMSSIAQTPVPRRGIVLPHNPLALQYPTASPQVPPASEPAMRRRQRRRVHGGTNLSKQLSELEEDVEVGSSSRPEAQRTSQSPPISISPPNSQPRQPMRRARAHTRTYMSGSETETDTEMTTRPPGPETESIRLNPANGAAPSGSNRLRSASQRAQLPPMPPGNAQRRQSQADRDNDNSGGETTETDEDFFGPSHAVHASIRPPRRVVRQLASLRARHQQPAALDLNGYAYAPHPDAPMPGHQPRTAPVSADSANGAPGGFGLGITSAMSMRDGSARGTGRVLSTPSMAAAPALVAAVRSTAHPPPPHAPYPQMNAHGNSPMVHNGYAQREYARDPFVPASNEFTYRGAALRRLERSGGAEAGHMSRKRALTAPSSYDSPLRRRAPYALGNKMASAADALLEDDHEDSFADSASGYCTPPERSRHLGNRSSLLGESPVSSLRSSLIARVPILPPTQHAQASTSHTQPTSSVESEPVAELMSGPGSPSMDAALRQSRKRRRSPSHQSPQSPQPDCDLSPASRRHVDGSPATDGPDAMFPPIDRDAS